jgi:hypothetical protein
LLFFISVCHCYSYQHHSYLSRYCGNLKSGLLAQLCLQIIFFIAILEGEPRRFEPRPDRETSKQTKLKLCYFFAICHTIIHCVVVIMLVTLAMRIGSNPCMGTNFFNACLDYLTIVDIIFISFFLILYINRQNERHFLKGKILKISNH